MEPSSQIRDAVAQVSVLRQACEANAVLRDAVSAIKTTQARRFSATYADLLAGEDHAAAARFFLEELYGDRDYAQRDAQFSRIAGAVQRLFPQQIVATAVALAQLHLLTEQLDHAMGAAWPDLSGDEAARYVQAWRITGRRDARRQQLDVVMEVGREMMKFTRTPGLRLMLRMMRGPAAAAGLSALQNFLETGFDTFGDMARTNGRAERFLQLVEQREAAFIHLMFDTPPVACETELRQTLGIAR